MLCCKCYAAQCDQGPAHPSLLAFKPYLRLEENSLQSPHYPPPPTPPRRSAGKQLATNGAHLEGDEEEGGRGSSAKSALPFKPLIMTFTDIRYSVPLPAVSRAGQAWGRPGLWGLTKEGCVHGHVSAPEGGAWRLLAGGAS